MQTPHTWRELIDQLLLRKTPFFAVFFMVIFATYGILYALDFYPEPVTTTDSATAASSADDALPAPELAADTDETNQDTTSPFSVTIPDTSDAETTEAAPATIDDTADSVPTAASGAYVEPAVDPVLPDSMYIERLDRTVPVLNPMSREIADLDEALLGGTVRHPDSADLANTGNIFILGHSSYLPNVLNRNFQAFNGIQSLEWGDRIVLTADGEQYVYRVERVYEAKASDVIVPHTPGEARLTLATCDSFGSQDDRFIVEARLVGGA